MFKETNPNPTKNLTSDCLVRALSILLDKSWEYMFIELCVYAYSIYDMPTSMNVCNRYLTHLGYTKQLVPYHIQTIKQFCEDYPNGRYLLVTSNHAVTVIDGNYLDAWDSGYETPIYYFTKEK